MCPYIVCVSVERGSYYSQTWWVCRGRTRQHNAPTYLRGRAGRIVGAALF